MAREGYPSTYGKPMKGVLSEFLTPLSIECEGDNLVPENDMGEIALAGRESVPDPLSYVSVIEKGGK